MPLNTPADSDSNGHSDDGDGATEEGSGSYDGRKHRSTLRDSMVRFDEPRAKPDTGELDEL